MSAGKRYALFAALKVPLMVIEALEVTHSGGLTIQRTMVDRSGAIRTMGRLSIEYRCL